MRVCACVWIVLKNELFTTIMSRMRWNGFGTCNPPIEVFFMYLPSTFYYHYYYFSQHIHFWRWCRFTHEIPWRNTHFLPNQYPLPACLLRTFAVAGFESRFLSLSLPRHIITVAAAFVVVSNALSSTNLVTSSIPKAINLRQPYTHKLFRNSFSPSVCLTMLGEMVSFLFMFVQFLFWVHFPFFAAVPLQHHHFDDNGFVFRRHRCWRIQTNERTNEWCVALSFLEVITSFYVIILKLQHWNSLAQSISHANEMGVPPETPLQYWHQ